MIGRDGQYHVSRWPPGWRSDRRRVPAILTKSELSWQIIDSQGQVWPVASHAEVLTVMANPYGETTKPTKLDVYVDRLPHYPWLKEAMQDEKTSAYPRGRERIGGLVCGYGRLKLRIEEAAAWGAEKADAAFLTHLSTLYGMLEVGAFPTPGGLGLSVMETEYLNAGYQRQSRPSQALRQALLDHRIGGRSDWTDSDETYAQVWECDQRNSYCSAAAEPLPYGGVTRFLEGEITVRDRMYRTWFAECRLYNAWVQDNSPVLERLPSGRLCPFVRHGHFTCWIWKEEAEAFARRPGCQVVVLDGWGWTRMEPFLKPWAEKMHGARAIAAGIDPAIESMVKLCIVAAIGRHGCRPERRTVVPISQATEGDVVLVETLDAEWATHIEPELDAPWLTPVHDFIVMLIRLKNYDIQIAEAAHQNVAIGSNVDAVYFLGPPSVTPQPDVLGGWRIREKHGVRFPYVRGLICDEKVALPGIARDSPKRGELTNVQRG